MKTIPDTVKLYRNHSRIVKAWVVVVNPGMFDQYEDSEFSSYTSANKHCNALNADNVEADVMKRLPDGKLTTEF
jgi:hypothetical protein